MTYFHPERMPVLPARRRKAARLQLEELVRRTAKTPKRRPPVIVAAVIAIVLGIPATRYFGLPGVIWSMVIANVLYVAVAFLMLQRKMATLNAADADGTLPAQAEEGAF